MEFPITNKGCPVCGSTNSIGRWIAEQTNRPAEEVPAVSQTVTPLINPQTLQALALTPMQVDMLICRTDVCAGCGCCYLAQAVITKGVVHGQQPPSVMGPLPPGFGRG